MFLKKEKDPTTKQFDDDEWIRSLAEAQEVTTDIPENSVTHDQQDVDPKKVRPIQMGEFWRKYVSRRLGGPHDFNAAVRSWHSRWRRAIFHLLLHDEWMTGSLSGPLARIKVDEKNCFWDDGMEGGARGGVAVSPKAHSSSSVETWNVSFVEQEGLSPMPKDRGA